MQKHFEHVVWRVSLFRCGIKGLNPRICQHTPGTYPRPRTNSLWRNSFHLEVWGGLGYAPGVCWGSLRLKVFALAQSFHLSIWIDSQQPSTIRIYWRILHFHRNNCKSTGTQFLRGTLMKLWRKTYTDGLVEGICTRSIWYHPKIRSHNRFVLIPTFVLIQHSFSFQDPFSSQHAVRSVWSEW